MSSNRFVSSLNKENFSLLMLVNFSMAFIGSIFLAWNGVQAGIVYTLMFVGILALMFLVFIFLKDDNTLKPITNYVGIPISTKLSLSVLFYLFGIVLPFVLNFVIGFFSKGFSITNYSVPLFASDILAGGQSFATASFGESMSWKLFNMMFVAGNIETLVYNFGLILLFVLIGVFILKLINGSKKSEGNRYFVLIFSFAMTTVLFSISHLLNQSYGLEQFIIAGFFLLIANTSIYLSGVFLSFWAGYHQSNNLLYLIQVEGLVPVLNGFLDWFGVLFIIYIGLQIYFLLTNWELVKKDFTKWLN
jgi:hypothetical protein